MGSPLWSSTNATWSATPWCSASLPPTKNTAATNAMSELYVRNRQRTQPINLKLLESIALFLVGKTCPAEYRVGVLLVGEREMSRLNEAFLKHAGPTDVLAFGYA